MCVCAFVCIHEFIKRIMYKGYVNSLITLNFIISVYTFNYKNKHLFMDAQTIDPLVNSKDVIHLKLYSPL